MPQVQNDDHTALIQSLIDMQDDLMMVTYNAQPIFFNQAFKSFFGLNTLKEFSREIGSMEYRFVPHDTYFHANKMHSDETWTQSIQRLEKEKRMVSMINTQTKPHAFSVTLQQPIDGYEIVQFKDISQMLIKRILVENDASLNKTSGAYSKEYFLHTAHGYMDTADLNEKRIALSLIKLQKNNQKIEIQYLKELVSTIKSAIRSEDMLVQWDSHIFLLAYLIDNEANAKQFTEKIHHIIQAHQFKEISSGTILYATVIEEDDKEELEAIIARAIKKLE